jgi:prepilin-type N-terminal cleavage/methylation domain-containing protein
VSLTISSPSKGTRPPCDGRWREQRGYTLIELLVAMAIGLVVSLGAFTFLEFASGDVSRVTERVHVTQIGRVALEKIMLELHSVCVTPEVNPILQESNGSIIKFVSETGKGATFPTVKEHEIIYTAGSGTTEGTLIEKTYASIGEAVKGNYTFSTTVLSTTRLLKGVRQTTESTPIFRYYRYYHKADATPVYGEVDPTPITPLTKEEAEELTKVTVSFTLAPEGKESSTFKNDRPVAFEDSALFRLSPPSTASEHINAPCSEQP